MKKYLAHGAAILGLAFVFSIITTAIYVEGNEESRPAAPRVQEIEQPAVVVETLDPSLARYSPLWQAEIGRRFSHAVGVFVHGGDIVDGEWVVRTSIRPGHSMRVQEVVSHFQALYPTRTIVLLACNPGHLKLGIPGVYYAKSNVWCVPDRALAEVTDRWQKYPEVVGNIYELVKD